MNFLPWNFAILQFCGVWQPARWSDGWKKYFYNVYTISSMLLIYTFALSGLIQMAISESLDGAANSSFLALSMVGVSYKMTNWVLHKNNIIVLIDILYNEVCRPRGTEEIAIQMKFDRISRNNTILFGGMTAGAVIAVTIGSFLDNVSSRTLPFPTWLPFDCTTELRFWMAFLHQILAHGIAAAIGCFHDTLLHGFMIEVCAKLNILKFRLHSIPGVVGKKKLQDNDEISEREQVKLCVRQHEEIHKFVKRSNEIFSVVMLVQFSVSAFTICMSTYILSKMTMHSPGLVFLIVYVGCMIVQIFLLCWYGNEVIMESMDVSDAIYDMDWCSLKASTKKDLRLMMTRTHYRLQYTSGHMIILSLDSYNKLMKLTYSMYNLLQKKS